LTHAADFFVTQRGAEYLLLGAGWQPIRVGHFDLSNFMGIPGQFDHPDFLAAMHRVADVAKKHGKVAGFMATDKAWIERAKSMGYTMLAAGTDTGLLQQSLGQLVEAIDMKTST
jgi:2-keto-3-deoxy-L-rhamnonate aldolase RhmA